MKFNLAKLKSYKPFETYVFHPSNLLIDWLSTFILAGWLITLVRNGDVMLARNIYEGFHSFSTDAWIAIFAAAFIVHVASLFYRGQFAIWLRFTSMVVATSIWTFVAINFMAFSPPNMATWTFGSLALICFVQGIRITWISSSHHF